MGIMCSSSQYEYKGIRFEWHHYCGPMPIDAEGEPTDEVPTNEWYDLAVECDSLPEEEKSKYRTYQGGCKTF